MSISWVRQSRIRNMSLPPDQNLKVDQFGMFLQTTSTWRQGTHAKDFLGIQSASPFGTTLSQQPNVSFTHFTRALPYMADMNSSRTPGTSEGTSCDSPSLPNTSLKCTLFFKSFIGATFLFPLKALQLSHPPKA